MEQRLEWWEPREEGRGESGERGGEGGSGSEGVLELAVLVLGAESADRFRSVISCRHTEHGTVSECREPSRCALQRTI